MATSTVQRPFRQHTQAEPMHSPLVQQLCQEWVGLNTSQTIRDTVERWAAIHSAMHGLDSPAAITDRIDRAGSREADILIGLLLSLFHDGEQLAGRILLQQLLPGLTVHVRRVMPPRGTAYDEVLQQAIVEFWTVITTKRNLPADGIAGRIWLDPLKPLTRHRRSHDAWETHTVYTGEILSEAGPDSSTQPDAAFDLNPEGDLYNLILAFRRDGILSEADAQLLADVYLSPAPGERTLAQAAERLGISHAALRKRCNRVKNRVVDALVADRRAAALEAAA